MSRRRTRTIGLALTTVATGTAGVQFASIEAALASHGPTTYTHNIHGAQPPNYGGLSAVQPLKDWMGFYGELPYAIHTQETCNDQFDNLKTYLRDRTGNLSWGALHPVRQVNCAGPGDKNFGPASYLHSAYDPWQQSGWIETRAFTTQAPDGENRGWACLLGAWNATFYWSCSAHMAPWEPTRDFAAPQFHEYRTVAIEPKRQAVRTFWGGDFYREPGWLDNDSCQWPR